MPSSPLVVASAPAVRPPSLQKPFGYRERKPQIQKGTESMSSSEIPVLGDLGIIGLLHSLVFLFCCPAGISFKLVTINLFRCR